MIKPQDKKMENFVTCDTLIRSYGNNDQYFCHLPVGWVYRVETQRKLNVFVGFCSIASQR
jgi:hypothetical protein